MEQGLYILVETYVPENVKDTTSPFLVSLPMTTIDADNWNYDVTVYGSAQTPPTMIHSRTTAISTFTVWISSSSSLTARVTSKMSSSSSTTIPISTG